MTERPMKRLRVGTPLVPEEPKHSKCYQIEASLKWKYRERTGQLSGKFLIDTGCTGPILNKNLIGQAMVPVHQRKNPTPILDASGRVITGAGEFYTVPLEMVIGKHVEGLAWEVSPLQDV
ncbi:hypothetical protein P167DRAFT_580845 [Morchella conica CCBAS932]|uniref:Peptidase A2 domain-containing protein n=1 Tax=Morchella conica CCBAS932 TaxID=1392247 RepID=A0A3N4K9Y4_9PEZI|nr:hypothetical protein P167DRAFT_580845 [Morchella conica CCBAS932]